MVRRFALIVLAFGVLLGTLAKATIIEITDVARVDRTPIPEDLWDFDYDLQVLTLTDFIYEVGEQPLDIWSHRAVIVMGFADPDSQFTFIRHFTNLTDVSLTGFSSEISGCRFTTGEIVEGSVWATGFPEVYQDDRDVELTWADPIPVGGSFTLQFDINILDSRGLCVTLSDTAIPEPSTVVLFGLGGLTLLRNRRYVGGVTKHRLRL